MHLNFLNEEIVNSSLDYVYENFDTAETFSDQIKIFLSASQLVIQDLNIHIFPEFFLAEHQDLINLIFQLTNSQSTDFKQYCSVHFDMMKCLEKFQSLKFTNHNESQLREYLNYVDYDSLLNYYLELSENITQKPNREIFNMSSQKQMIGYLTSQKIIKSTQRLQEGFSDNYFEVLNFASPDVFFLHLIDLLIYLDKDLNQFHSFKKSLNQEVQIFIKVFYHMLKPSTFAEEEQLYELEIPTQLQIGVNSEMIFFSTFYPKVFAKFLNEILNQKLDYLTYILVQRAISIENEESLFIIFEILKEEFSQIDTKFVSYFNDKYNRFKVLKKVNTNISLLESTSPHFFNYQIFKDTVVQTSSVSKALDLLEENFNQYEDEKQSKLENYLELLDQDVLDFMIPKFIEFQEKIKQFEFESLEIHEYKLSLNDFLVKLKHKNPQNLQYLQKIFKLLQQNYYYLEIPLDYKKNINCSLDELINKFSEQIKPLIKEYIESYKSGHYEILNSKRILMMLQMKEHEVSILNTIDAILRENF